VAKRKANPQAKRRGPNPQAKRGVRKMRRGSAPTAAQRAQLERRVGGRGRPNAQRGRRS
jgi:hypothetical protein